MNKLKPTITALFILVMSFTLKAQAPKDGILIKMDQYTLDVSAGSAETKVFYVRSKRLSKVKLEAPKVQSQEGLNISVEPIDSEPDAYKLLVTATEPIVENFTLTIDGSGRWKSKTRSAMFTVSGTLNAQVSK